MVSRKVFSCVIRLHVRFVANHVNIFLSFKHLNSEFYKTLLGNFVRISSASQNTYAFASL
jgi:hypothetical protein